MSGSGPEMRRLSACTRVMYVRIRAVCRVALLAACAAAALAGPARAQTPPTVSTGQPIAVTTTGAVVAVTVNPGGSDTLYHVLFGPTGGPLSFQAPMSFWNDAGSGTSDAPLTVAIDQLQPNTSITYQAQVFQLATLTEITDTGTGSFTTPAAPLGPGQPLVPPQNPTTSGIFSNCASDAQCVSDASGVRAMQEGLPPLAGLPSNWSMLTGNEQLFVATNMERISRGEAPIPNLVNSYDGSVLTGVQTDSDPSLAGLPGLGETIWAGAFATPLGAIYEWLYFDGPGGTNLECTTPTSPHCWGHRDALLDNPGGTIGNPTEMDAIAGTDNSGRKSYAALLVNNPSPTPPGSIVFSWADELQFFTPPPLGGAPHGAVPKDRHLVLVPSRFRAAAGRKRPAVLLTTPPSTHGGTAIAYTDSLPATTTFTVEQQVTGVINHGKCVAAPIRRKNPLTKRCTRYRTVGSFTHADSRGINRLRFMGRLNGRALSPGIYLMTASPLSRTGRHGPTLEHAFTIVR